jgi:asparagine synthase (glutamine-hydrolysing)
VFEGDAVREHRYWDAQYRGEQRASPSEWRERFLAQFRDSVKSHLMSEVPLGAFLSGGVDSSSVVASMAKASVEPVNTCSIAFDDPAYDESRYARQVAERYRTRHFEDRVESDDFDLIDELARLYDEPYADSSAIPTYRVCQLARQHVTVALSGDGGDESFGGYRRYRLHLMEERLRSFLPLGVRRPLFGILGQVYPKADWAPRVAYLHSVSLVREPMRQQLFSRKLHSELGGYRVADVFERHAQRASTDDALALVQYLDMKTYLVGDINTKVDRASMAHSLEVREPLMDHPLVEWCASLPSSLKMQDGEGKYLLKKAMEPRLSGEILYRSKMGFAVPVERWFRGPLRQRVRDDVLNGALAETGYFEQTALRQMVEDHQSGRRDYSGPLWSALMFEAFLRNVNGMSRPVADQARRCA